MKRFLQRVIMGLSALSLIVIPATAAAAPQSYTAMGDSVAAGVGLSTEDPLCGRSSTAYPQLVGSSLGVMTNSVACSGATASDLYTDQDRNGTDIPAQIDAAFANGRPDVITITVGANDLGWQTFLYKCYHSTCGTDVDNAAAKVGRGYLRAELYWALLRIDQASNYNPPQVVLTGYFQPFSGQSCSDTQGLTTTEMSWLNSQTAQLNRAIYSVTPWFDFATYVPVSFSGHELCSANPWIQGLQDTAPFHPTAAGQQAYAQAVLPIVSRQ
jgi:lysophospholipase L1-like esterase